MWQSPQSTCIGAESDTGKKTVSKCPAQKQITTTLQWLLLVQVAMRDT
jgi:hypothetical protein